MKIGVVWGFLIGIVVWLVTHLIDREIFHQTRAREIEQANSLVQSMSKVRERFNRTRDDLDKLGFDPTDPEEDERWISVVEPDLLVIGEELQSIETLLLRQENSFVDYIILGRPGIERGLSGVSSIHELIEMTQESLSVVQEKIRALGEGQIRSIRSTG